MGFVRSSVYLPAGYVKANGATVSRADYPRLVLLADTYNLWTDDTVANPGLFGEGDGTDTMILPNWIDRMAQFSATAGTAKEAGLPNIVGVGNTGVCWSSSSIDSWGGAIHQKTSAKWQMTTGSSTNGVGVLSFDASKSNPVYGNSLTVQPSAIDVFPVMRY